MSSVIQSAGGNSFNVWERTAGHICRFHLPVACPRLFVITALAFICGLLCENVSGRQGHGFLWTVGKPSPPPRCADAVAVRGPYPACNSPGSDVTLWIDLEGKINHNVFPASGQRWENPIPLALSRSLSLSLSLSSLSLSLSLLLREILAFYCF